MPEGIRLLQANSFFPGTKFQFTNCVKHWVNVCVGPSIKLHLPEKGGRHTTKERADQSLVSVMCD